MLDPRIPQLEGWMTEKQLIWLYETALKVPKGGLIIESGAWMGKSSAAIYAGANGKIVVTIDNWLGSPDEPLLADVAKEKDVFGIYLSNMERLGYNIKPFCSFDKLTPGLYYLKADAFECFDIFPSQSTMWLFEDSQHSRCGEHIDKWYAKMAPGSIYSGHDYYAVQKAIHGRFDVHGLINSIWFTFIDKVKPEWF